MKLEICSYLFASAEGHVLVFDHVFDLPLHRDEEQDEPVEQQYRPEDRDVKYWNEGEDKA